MTHPIRRIPRLAGVAAGGTALVLALAACTADGGGAGGVNAGGPSVAHGASDADWQAAFDEIDDSFRLTFEIPSSAVSDQGKSAQALADRAAELSGGKVEIEIAFQYAVSGALTEVDAALEDGRLDFGMLTPYLESTDFPLSGTITNDTTMVYPTSQIGGFLAGWGAASEVWWDNDEFLAEMADHGLTVLSPQSAAPRSAMSCREPVTSLADLQGKQVRVAPITNFRQIEALGATPVSIPFTDLFESVQRGIVDCIVSGISTVGTLPGLAELIPYQITPVGTNFSGTSGYWVAGASWPDLPLTVQQLVYDLAAEMDLTNIQDTVLATPIRVLDAAAAAGGESLNFDDDVNEALAAFNETLIDDEWRGSALFDGEAFMSDFESAVAEWEGLVEEAGFSFAEFSEYDEWSTSTTDWAAFDKIWNERIVLPNRPS